MTRDESVPTRDPEKTKSVGPCRTGEAAERDAKMQNKSTVKESGTKRRPLTYVTKNPTPTKTNQRIPGGRGNFKRKA